MLLFRSLEIVNSAFNCKQCFKGTENAVAVEYCMFIKNCPLVSNSFLLNYIHTIKAT